MSDQQRTGVFARLFSIDLRSLAAFRIGIGLVLLADLTVRMGSLAAHYSDAGVLPRAEYRRLFLASPWQWSLHGISGTPAAQALLFALAGAAALSLTLGYRTRLATVVSWILLVSLHARNPMVEFGADRLLRMLLLWSTGLPLGARWSLDAVRDGHHVESQHLSMASAAILLQMFLMYSFSGIFKLNDAWLEGDALQSVFSLDMFARPLATDLLAFPGLLRAASRVIPWLEIGCAVLLFVPWWTVRLRTLALVLLATFHVSVGALLETGIFQYLSLSALLLFLPAGLWAWLARTQTARALHLQRTLSVLGERERAIATRRPTFASDALQTVTALLLVYVVVWNLCSLGARSYTREHAAAWMEQASDGPFRYRHLLPGYGVERMLGSLGWIGRAGQLHQQWNMFEEAGGTRDGWHVVSGTLADGRTISLLEGGAPVTGSSHRRPEHPASLYWDARWRVCFRYLIQANRARTLLGPPIARKWNRGHPDRPLHQLEIRYVEEPALPGGDPSLSRESVWFRGSVDDPDEPGASALRPASPSPAQTSRLRTDQIKPSYQ